MILGFEEAGDGPALLLVHAFPGDRRYWSAQVAALSQSRRVIAVDLPGRGLSLEADSEPDMRSMDLYADDVAETIRSLRLERVDLGGMSMGSYVAFSFWRRHRERVRSLILASARATEDPPEGKQGRKNVARLVREKGTAELIPMMFPKLFGPASGEEPKRQVETMIRELPPEAAAGDSLAMGKRPDSTGDLASMNVPTLVLHGEDDQLLPPKKAQEMAGLISGASFVAIPRSGHLLSLENPDAVNAALADFLQKVSPG